MNEIILGDCIAQMKPLLNQVHCGDSLEVLKTMPDGIMNCCVTSPPYWGLRDYGVEGQLGLEKTPEEYVAKLVEIFREVRRVLRDDGTLWLNLGDSYCGTGHKGDYKDPKYEEGRNGQRTALNNKIDGLKSKDLVGIPWMVAFALRSDGWYLRSDIIWEKPNAMPESVKDRPTKAHEYIFLLSKARKYYYDNEAIQEVAVCAGKKVKMGEKSFSKGQASGMNIAPSGNGLKDSYDVKQFKNKRTVWRVTTKPFKGAHFAVFPPDLIEPCILAGCPKGGVVLDPFIGSGTTAEVALQHGRGYFGIELNPEYIKIAEDRLCRSGGDPE